MKFKPLIIERPLLLPFAVLGLVLLIGFSFALQNWRDSSYSEQVGVVCCLSEKVFVPTGVKRSVPYKMMVITLQDGREVNVPVIDIPYLKGGRILIREVSDLTGPHPRYRAGRYLSSEPT